MEQIKILSREPANILLFNAICAACPSNELLKTFGLESKGNDTVATVEVRVNGVLVPFVGALDQAVEGILSKQKERIREEAIKLLTKSSLSDLHAAIRSAEWKIRAALDAIPE